MRNIKLLLILAGLCFVGFTSAQSDYTIDGPSHPLKPKFEQPRILADTVFTDTYVEMGREPMYPSWVNPYRFNENGRIDTICGATIWIILKYSEKDQLLSLSHYTPSYESPTGSGNFTEPIENLYVEFEYGDDGRITKVLDYTLDEEGVYLDSVYNYNYTMTDSGYIMPDFSIEYILDEKGRVVCQKDLTSKNEYVFDEEGRRFRIGDVYYFYFDNGFTSLKYSHRGELVLDAPDAWSKMDYFFQENGYLSKKIDYLKEEGDTEWTIYNHDEWSYGYRSDNPQSNIAIEEKPDGTVYTAAGAVMIEAEKTTTVSVYSVSGQLVTQQCISAGTNRIPLSNGVYIVVINDKGYKVFVK